MEAERPVDDVAPHRSSRDIYFELLVTVGLFAIPAMARSAFVSIHPDAAIFDARYPDWQFGMAALSHVLMLGLLWRVVRLNGERLAKFTTPLSPPDFGWAIALGVGGIAV